MPNLPKPLKISPLWSAELEDIAQVEEAHSTDPLSLPQLRVMWESQAPVGAIGAYRGKEHVRHLVFGRQGRSWWIASLLVLPSQRRQGVGGALLYGLMKYIPAGKRLHAVVRDTNREGQEFLKRMGFQAIRVLPSRFSNPPADGYLFVGEPSVVLTKHEPVPSQANP